MSNIRNVIITYKDGSKFPIDSEDNNMNDSGMKLMVDGIINGTINQSIVKTSGIQKIEITYD